MPSQINGITALPAANGIASVSQTTNEGEAGSGGFQNMLSDMMRKVNDMQIQGDQATMALHAGKVENLHEVMLAVEEADLSLRMLVQFRNKAQAAYDEIMRISI
ncbi:MAG: flagellar hook-basal body complex protein FliE [Desulfobulbaceae bacterium]|jgi:flagellar hook-basal body complex protein FliE|nr:flagellar hook-basal body complex protein FliE [Desulfobulbaceae bacterium]